MKDRMPWRERAETLAPVTSTVVIIGGLLLKEAIKDLFSPATDRLRDSRVGAVYREIQIRRLIAPLNDSRFDRWRAYEEEALRTDANVSPGSSI